MHCLNFTVRYAVLPKQGALYPECVHYRLNWAEKGVDCSVRTEQCCWQPLEHKLGNFLLVVDRLTSTRAHVTPTDGTVNRLSEYVEYDVGNQQTRRVLKLSQAVCVCVCVCVKWGKEAPLTT